MENNPPEPKRLSDGEKSGDAPGVPGKPLHPMEWAVRSRAAADVMREMERRLRRRRRRRLGVVGAGAVALGFAFLVWRNQPAPAVPAPAGATASVVVNRPARQTLPDGSTVELKPGTSFRVQFTDEVRRVVLERGEAHFDVMKNAARPFVVQAGALDVRAVGTAFSVQLTAATTEVIVTEGQVAMQTMTGVASAGAGSTDPGSRAGGKVLAFVPAGSRAVIEAGAHAAAVPRIEPMSADDLAARLGWRVPQLELSGCPLREALPLFNRHSRLRLVLGDDSLGQLRISGLVRADNFETLLRMLEEEHAVIASRRGDSEVVLARRR